MTLSFRSFLTHVVLATWTDSGFIEVKVTYLYFRMDLGVKKSMSKIITLIPGETKS